MPTRIKDETMPRNAWYILLNEALNPSRKCEEDEPAKISWWA